MVVQCIKCGVVSLTKTKLEMLDFEFNGFQWWMQFGIDIGILSQHKKAKGYSYKNIKYHDYPMILPNNQVWLRKRETKLSKYWIKISVSKKKGVGIWLPIKPHKNLPDKEFLRDSLLLKNKKGNYELRLIFDVPVKKKVPKNILAVDLGERVIATVCDSKGNKFFLGREIRGIRRHYAWLRRRLGKKKLLKKIKAIGDKEKRLVRNKLHHIANTIIEQAENTNSVITLGLLKGIRKKTSSKMVNRMIHNMPYFELTRIITYKAAQKGITTITISEKDTSITCHKCGKKDKKARKTQGLFKCECGLEYNADLNASINLIKRAKDQGFLAGAIAEAQKSSVATSG